MIGTIRLYKGLGFKEDNTMYFSSLTAQQNFFNSIPSNLYSEYQDVSYNGSRAFRIGVNSIDFLFMKYDYLRYEFPDENNTTKVIYAFINNINYVNDNCCDIDATIDVLQTFMFEIFDGYKSSVIKSYTLKQSNFEYFLPYSNKYSVDEYDIKEIGELKPNLPDGYLRLGYLVATFDPLIVNLLNTDEKLSLTQHYTLDNDLRLPFITLAFPLYIGQGFQDANDIYGIEHVTEASVASYDNFYNWFNYHKDTLHDGIESYLLNMAIVTTPFGDETYYLDNSKLYVESDETFKLIRLYTRPMEQGFNFYGIQVLKNIENSITINLNNYKYSIYKQPYYYLKIGNGFDSIDINMLDFFNKTDIPLDTNLTIKYLTSLTFPFQVSLKLSFGDMNFKEINMPLIVSTSENMIYETTAWAQYVSQNRQYASMGLETQQKYERASQYARTSVNLAGAIIGATLGATSITSGTHTTASIVNGKKSLTTAQTYSSNYHPREAISTSANSILGSVGDLVTMGIEQSKECSMRTIQFNDIKTSPSEYNNLSSPITTRFASIFYPVSVYEYKARNIDDVEKYHNIYGYEINKTLPAFSFYNLPQHTQYDYISFVNLFIKGQIPRQYEQIAEDLLTNGVRFWYNYNNFLDYSVANTDLP